ncbi:MAG: MotA/TolQ/ExbB proton channel family protein [Planctomycetes bacterium]|nr:MotA/TolQ/ExbB proton channel family protein [Planctomycetota bacterium]
MKEFFTDCGLFGWMVCLIVIANFILFVRSGLRLRNARPEDGPRFLYGINAILFWGAVAALLGFLGQYSGLYLALEVFSRASEISPNLVAQGFAISFSTTIMGMFALLFSALAWFVLHGWYRRKFGAMNGKG